MRSNGDARRSDDHGIRRRGCLLAAGTATLGGIAGCIGPPRSQSPASGVTDDSLGADEWPMFRRGDRNVGHNPSAPGPDREPPLSWAFETDDSVWSSPVVSDGTAYVGSYDGGLYAIDVDSGGERWRFGTDDRIDGSPAVVDGVVYVGSFDQNVYAVDADSGEEVWRFETGGIVRSSPTVVDDVLYVGSHCRTTECARYYDEEFPETGFVHALEAATGEPIWSFAVDDETLSSPAVDDRRIYVGSADETIYAIDREDGEADWTYDAGQPVFGSPALDGDRLYVTSNRSLVRALDAATGELIWEYDPGVSVLTGSPAVAGGRVFVAGGPVETPDLANTFCTLQAVDADDGTGRWSTDVAGEVIGASPAVADGTVYVGSHNNSPTSRPVPRLVAYTTDGEQYWEYRLDEAPFAGSEDGSSDDLVGFGSSPAVAGEKLYVGSADGHLYAFGPASE